MFVNTHTKYYRLVCWPLLRFLLLALETQTYTQGRLLLPLTIQVASMLFGLISTQAPLITCSTHSSKLPFIQKAAAIVVIVWGMTWGAYTWDEINIQANVPSALCLKVVCKKGGGIFGSLRYYYVEVSMSTSVITWDKLHTSDENGCTVSMFYIDLYASCSICVQCRKTDSLKTTQLREIALFAVENAPSPLLPQSGVQKGGGVFLGAYGILSDIYLRELSDVIDVCLLSGAVESSAVIVPQQALRQSLLLFCYTTCSSSAALLQVVDKLVVDAPLNQQVLMSLMFWTSWWSFHYWWRVYLSCNFDCMLSVGPIRFEGMFCASKKGGIEGGGQT